MKIMKKTYMINDPVHGAIRFDEKEKDIIKPILDHPLFQRLRHIKQLSFADLIYPGAVHTRFNHCIGTFHVAKLIFEKISYVLNHDGNKDDYDRNKNLVIISALLHDVSHGPFSHAFERLFSDSNFKIKHEDWTDCFIDEIFSSNEVRNNSADTWLKERVKKLIKGERKNALGIPDYMFDIISSQLDADRLDYLLRDAHFCGVKYGLYSIDWLLNCLTVSFINENDIRKYRLGVVEKGIGAIEHYLSARRLMSLNVYYHKKKCAAEFLFEKLMCYSSEQANLNQIGKLGIDDDLFKLLSNLSICLDSKTKKMEFITRNYEHYKSLTDESIWSYLRLLAKSKDKALSNLRLIALRILQRRLPIVYSIDSSMAETLHYTVGNFMSQHSEIEPWQVSCEDIEFETYKDTQDKKIYVVKDNLVSISLDFASHIISSVINRSDKAAYLYIDCDIQKKDIIIELKKELENKKVITLN